ncbi:MAG: MFS transporter [Porticoccaceae bacterium]
METMPQASSELSPRTEKLIYATAFFSLSNEVLMGLALPLLAAERGLPATTLGMLFALAALGPILLALPAGALCDHFGDKKVLLVLTSGIAITPIFYPFVSSLAGLFALQIIAGICRSNAWVAVQSYMVRETPLQALRKIAGKFTFFVNVGLMTAPVLGGVAYTAWGATAAFGFMGFWGACYALFTFLLPDQKEQQHDTQPAWKICIKSYRAAMPIFLRPMLVIMLLLTLARLMSGGIDISFYAVYLDDIGLAAATIGILMTLMNGSATLGSLVADPLAERLGLIGAMVWTIAISAIAIAVLPLFYSVWFIAFASIIHGFSLGISMPLLLTGISQYSKPNERGLVLGLRSMFNRGGVMLAPLLLGFLVSGWGMLWGFLTMGAIILLLLAAIGIAARFINQEAPNES